MCLRMYLGLDSVALIADIFVFVCLYRWVKTANGQAFADSIGVAEPPMSVEESARGVLAQVCFVPIFQQGNHATVSDRV